MCVGYLWNVYSMKLLCAVVSSIFIIACSIVFKVDFQQYFQAIVFYKHHLLQLEIMSAL